MRDTGRALGKWGADAVELGGSIFLKENRFMYDFAKFAKLEIVPPFEDGRFGIWNGKDFVFEESKFDWISKLKAIWRWGLSPLRLKKIVGATVQQFEQVYQGKDFHSLDEFLEMLGLTEHIHVPLNEWLETRGVGKRFVEELVAGILRWNYNSNTSIQAFAGLVGLAGSGSSIRSIAGGNAQLSSFLLDNATRSRVLHKHNVTLLNGTSVNSNGTLRHFDAVIIACPLSQTLASGFGLESYAYRPVYVTLVVGLVDPRYFGRSLQPDSIPTTIATTDNPAIPFFSLARLKTLTSTSKNRFGGTNLYKLFSAKELSDDFLRGLFIVVEQVERFPWDRPGAYPYLRPIKEPGALHPLIPDEKVFLASAMEGIVSTLETQAVAGRNAALLALKALSGQGHL
mmetsp:Transcript_42747/g.69311  ORF Transcript_42747/g.69311 Transcript_42747/m.69311 type:complete len:398 (-) Transcript_42747:308-1501(-)